VTPCRALQENALQPADVWTKSVRNKGHFTLETWTVFPPYLASHWSHDTDTAHPALQEYALHWKWVWFKYVSNEALLLRRGQYFLPISPHTEATTLRRHILHTNTILHKQHEFGLILSVMKGTLLLRHEEPVTETAIFRQHILNSRAMIYKHCEFSVSCSVTEGFLLFGHEEFFLPVSPHTEAGTLTQRVVHSQNLVYTRREFHLNRSVLKCTLL
jgi:hypothetical protein